MEAGSGSFFTMSQVVRRVRLRGSIYVDTDENVFTEVLLINTESGETFLYS
jgi:hypothetical protein